MHPRQHREEQNNIHLALKPYNLYIVHLHLPLREQGFTHKQNVFFCPYLSHKLTTVDLIAIKYLDLVYIDVKTIFDFPDCVFCYFLNYKKISYHHSQNF